MTCMIELVATKNKCLNFAYSYIFAMLSQYLLELLSILTRSDDLDSKLRWLFSLYDINGDGVITEDEIHQLIEAVYDLIQHHEQKIGEMTAEEHAAIVFEVRDR